MKKISSLVCIVGLVVIWAFTPNKTLAQTAENKPNVLFIAVDDLNSWLGCISKHSNPKTPNIDKLAARGVLFTNAHC